MVARSRRDLTSVEAALADAERAFHLRTLPEPVRLFQHAVRKTALDHRDAVAASSALAPPELAALVALARGATRVAEIGTGPGWTAASLVLAADDTSVWTCDPARWPHLESYLSHVPPQDRARLTLVERLGEEGPPDGELHDVVFIDAIHERAECVAQIMAWRTTIAKGGFIVLDDYVALFSKGVAEAVDELELVGRQLGRMFVWANA